jgi:O-succinylbenzoic acid--CoA ligase
MFDVDFTNNSLQVLCKDEYKKIIPEILEKLQPFKLENHFILFSSGTTGGEIKGYALSKKALFKNAEAVNLFFNLNTEDVWALSLPLYHVGGLSVLARAHLLSNNIIDARRWDPDSWCHKIQKATITTLVPTQLFDLIQRKIKPPPHLKYLIVGGDFLSSKLKQDALDLGWPVIRTFGMSEVSSQLASSRSPQSDDLEILRIHKVKTLDSRLLVKSESLFTLEFLMGKEFKVTMAKDLCDEKNFYFTKDLATMKGNILIPQGRLGDEFKISGHLINLNQLKDILSSILIDHHLFNQMEFIIESDDRKGNKIILVCLAENYSEEIIQQINDQIKPVKIDEVRIVANFLRTELGKLKKVHP